MFASHRAVNASGNGGAGQGKNRGGRHGGGEPRAAPPTFFRPPVRRVGCAVAVPRFGLTECPPRGTTTLSCFEIARLWAMVLGWQLLCGAALRFCDELEMTGALALAPVEEILWKVYPASSLNL